MKLHVSAFIGHLQVSTIIQDESERFNTIARPGVKVYAALRRLPPISTPDFPFFSVYIYLFLFIFFYVYIFFVFPPCLQTAIALGTK